MPHAARAAGDAVGVNDPDVTHVRVTVEVRAPAHDPGPDPATLARRRIPQALHHVELAFPVFDPDDVFVPGRAVDVDARITSMSRTSRRSRRQRRARLTCRCRERATCALRLPPHCADKPNYFGTHAVRDGLTSSMSRHARAAQSEADCFVAQAARSRLNAIMLQPAPDIAEPAWPTNSISRADGLTLTARPGERVVFGASAALRHSLAGDAARSRSRPRTSCSDTGSRSFGSMLAATGPGTASTTSASS